MEFTGERIQEGIKSMFRGKPLFKFNSYDIRKLDFLLKEHYSVKSYVVNYVREIITITPSEELGTEPVELNFIKFQGWGKNRDVG